MWHRIHRQVRERAHEAWAAPARLHSNTAPAVRMHDVAAPDRLQFYSPYAAFDAHSGVGVGWGEGSWVRGGAGCVIERTAGQREGRGGGECETQLEGKLARGIYAGNEGR